jgi:hypothetical protein
VVSLFSNQATACIRRTKSLAQSGVPSQYAAAVTLCGVGDFVVHLLMVVYVQTNKHQKAYLSISVHCYARSEYSRAMAYQMSSVASSLVLLRFCSLSITSCVGRTAVTTNHKVSFLVLSMLVNNCLHRFPVSKLYAATTHAVPGSMVIICCPKNR